MKKSIDFKYDTLSFKGRKEIRDICNRYIDYFFLAKGRKPDFIRIPRSEYSVAKQALAKVKYAEDSADFYFDSIPILHD